ncbi:hypothetical protein ACKQTC_04720 [Peptococcus simiae]|uniref:Uncharacterized protein n=1 Tax=Peptococcus simiae TaxID=1643805 RepID=A0ABW9H0H9_9FIRM
MLLTNSLPTAGVTQISLAKKGKAKGKDIGVSLLGQHRNHLAKVMQMHYHG